MRRPLCLIAGAAFSVALSADLSSAGPLNGGLIAGHETLSSLGESGVHKVHGWHCRKRKGWYHGKRRWHRHTRACQDYAYSDYPRYRRRPPLPYYSGPFYGPYYAEWQWERRNWLWD